MHYDCHALFVGLYPRIIYGLIRMVLNCVSEQSWRLYSAYLLRHQAAGTMTHYSTQSHYPETEPTLS